MRSLTPSVVHNVQTWSLSNVIFPFDFVLLLLLFIQSFTLVETELCSARRGEQNYARWSGVGRRSIEAIPKIETGRAARHGHRPCAYSQRCYTSRASSGSRAEKDPARNTERGSSSIRLWPLESVFELVWGLKYLYRNCGYQLQLRRSRQTPTAARIRVTWTPLSSPHFLPHHKVSSVLM